MYAKTVFRRGNDRSHGVNSAGFEKCGFKSGVAAVVGEVVLTPSPLRHKKPWSDGEGAVDQVLYRFKHRQFVLHLWCDALQEHQLGRHQPFLFKATRHGGELIGASASPDMPPAADNFASIDLGFGNQVIVCGDYHCSTL